MKDVDDLAALVVQTLTLASNKPTGLTILDHEVLPVEQDQLPVACVYVSEDKALEDASQSGSQAREATISVEIRAVGAVLAGTKTFREWVLATLLPLQGADFDINYAGFHPFGEVLDYRMSGAVLDFAIRYQWRP